MSSNSTISISFKVEDAEGGFKKMTVSADELSKAMKGAVVQASQLKTEFINFAAVASSLESVSSVVSNLQGTLKGLSDAYAMQVEAETQLATTMRNTMGATEAEVQSIKDLCSAQQELGVIGDEVQLAGAQELATYLSKKQSLEQLIPVMNDMLAQQYGLNATQENAVQIATMLGKVMDGQTGALSRYGYTFDEAQEQILKFGSEAERAAVLCDVVESSVGGMNAELAKTDAGQLKQAENSLGDLKEKLGEIAQSIMPLVTIGASIVLTVNGFAKMVVAVKAITAAMKGAALAVKGWQIGQGLTNVIIRATGLFSKNAAVGLQLLSTSAKGAERAVFTLKIALNGLLMASAIGAIIWALSAAISAISGSSDDATDSAHKLIDAEERAKKASEDAAASHSEEESALRDARSELALYIIKLENFKGSKVEEQRLVDELNKAYGESMGVYSTVSEWYKTLTANSEKYCRQIVLETRARTLANKIAAKEQENYEIDENINKGAYKGERAILPTNIESEMAALGLSVEEALNKGIIEYKGLAFFIKELDKAKLVQAENTRQAKEWEGELRKVSEESARITFTKPEPAALPIYSADQIAGMGRTKVEEAIKKNEEYRKSTLDSGELKALKANYEQLKKRKEEIDALQGFGTTSAAPSPTNKTKESELSDKIRKAKEEYVTASEEQRAQLRENIAQWQAELAQRELLMKEAERPLKLETMADYDNEIAYQQALRKTANAEEAAALDATIAQLYKRRDAIEESSYVPVAEEEIKSYEQLEEAIAHCNETLKTATSEAERIAIQKNKNALDRIKEEWDAALNDLEKPADIALLGSVKELDDAISYYRQKQNEASADEIQNLQLTIDALEAKKEAQLRGIDLASKQREVNEISGLSDREFKTEVRAIGFDALIERIKELNKQLNDAANPPTDKQRKQINELIATYKSWAKECIDTFGNVRSGWEGVKGIGGGIQSITQALDDNANAWSALTGIVDGFLQIYDGIKAIIDVINLVSTASTLLAGTKTTEAGATVAATTAEGAQAAAAPEIAAAQAPVIAANKAAAASFMELAAASFYAAHAYIPFAGFGIATGFITMAKTIVAAMGATPFADGGIVSGPTLGLIGEYAGASNNPEVVAPLDKLRSMISPAGQPTIIGGTLRASGRDIVCVLANETRISSKSGLRTNIKI